ncbi:MAG: diaminopimelate epimerase [Candidatus Sericytochromatia bacterium]|nr:MAG: diaminopimelate epimerase [Candidatus Sericytochromatia bacterium]
MNLSDFEINKIPFIKMHGCGNDFIIIDYNHLENIDIQAFSKKICNRNFGIGADGLIISYPTEHCDFKMRIINSDGSESEMCGNGIRCFAHYLRLTGKTNKDYLEIETLAGIIKPHFVKYEKNVSFIKVNMGKPILEPEKIPINNFKDKVISEKYLFENKEFTINAVSMGNPHCIIFVKDLDKFDFYYWGPKIEKHNLFPKKTNVEFAQVIDNKNIKVKVWERGAGETLACGTGACATLVTSFLNNFTENKANIHLPGGTLNIEWNDNIYMTGPSEFVFFGYI